VPGFGARVVAPPGEPVGSVARWSLGDRAAAALQLVCATAFLHDLGWYPSRRMLRGARVEHRREGVRLRLAELPDAGLDERGPRRLSATAAAGRELTGALLQPLLRPLVPELWPALAAAARRQPTGDVAAAWVGALLSSQVRARALRHPDGAGRSLWAVRWPAPQAGAWWVASEEAAARLAVVAALTAQAEGRPLALRAGEVEEDELLRDLSRSAADGRDGVVVTTLASPAAPPLLLDGGEHALWVLAAEPGLAARWVAAVAGQAGAHPLRTAERLSAGASRGFATAPRPAADDRVAERMATPAARRCLELLRSSPAGLAATELAALAPDADAAVVELQRSGLVARRAGVWIALHGVRHEPGELSRLAARLDASSPRRLLATALAGDAGPLVAWCDGELDAGRPVEVLLTARPAAADPPVACRCAEAALLQGLGAEAEELLARVPATRRDAHWEAVAMWRRDAMGEPPAASARPSTAGLPGRLASRVELAGARAARIGGDTAGERSALERAAAAGAGRVPAADILLAATEGPAGLRRLYRSDRARWHGDARAALLHEMAFRRYTAGAWAAAATGFRAALRCSAGVDLELLARIHADLAGTAILRELPLVAERHLHLAERLYERCGSRRALTLTRKNRAALACDRLDWREATRLLDGAGGGSEAEGLPMWLDELERIHVALARGDTGGVRRRLPVVESRLEPFLDRVAVASAIAGVRAHLALAAGDLGAVRDLAEAVEKGDRRLFLAVLRAAAGEPPPAGLPGRWGLAATARLLAAWRTAGPGAAAAALERDAARTPREAAVALARFAAILAANGERLGDDWHERRTAAVATLEEAGLDGWAAALAGATGGGVAAVVRALDGVVNAGSDALNPARLGDLARATGLAGLQVWRGGERRGAWGGDAGPSVQAEAAGVRVLGFGAGDAAEAVCRLLARNLSVCPEPADAPTSDGSSLVGRSQALAAVREAIARWAPLPAPVLVVGEPGTGKELVARELHRLSRRRGPLVPVNCAGIPETLMEAELFGAVRGAFTGADRDRIGLVEAAEGGTLLLDEIGELPPALQAKLLRLLQEHEVRRVGATRARRVDVRFVAATNRDLAAAVAEGGFRRDLRDRLDVAVIEVPPLRARLEDVADLAPLFLRRCAVEYERPGVSLAAEAIPALQRHHWPGNVRELEQAIRRAVAAAAPGEVLGPDRFATRGGRPGHDGGPGTWAAAQERLRREYFARLLAACGGNRSEAARRAGLSRQSLLYHLRALGIRGSDEAPHRVD